MKSLFFLMAGFGLAGFDGNVRGIAEPAMLNIPDYGATGDGTTKDTAAFKKAFEAIHAAGGGQIIVPAGTYVVGSIVLPSHITVRLEKGATILGSNDLSDYPLVTARWEGLEIECHRALIFADHADDISLVGEGTIQGSSKLGKSRHPRIPVLFEPTECQHIRIEGLTIKQSNVWTLHPVYCRDVTFSGLTFDTQGPNADGIDPDSCQTMHVDHCTFSTGDDCIAIKSGKGQEGKKIGRPTEDIEVSDCTFTKGHAGVAIGSEVSGDIRGVHLKNCIAKGVNQALRIKTCPGRGGVIEDISAEQLETSCPIMSLVTNYTSNPDSQGIEGEAGLTHIRNIRLSGIKADAKDRPLIEVEGMKEIPIDGLVISDITGTSRKGIMLRNAGHVDISRFTVAVSSGPLLVADNVHGTGMGLSTTSTSNPAP